MEKKRDNKKHALQNKRRLFKRKLGRYRHTRTYNRISGGSQSILSFSQSRNRKILIGLAFIIILIGVISIFLSAF